MALNYTTQTHPLDKDDKIGILVQYMM